MKKWLLIILLIASPVMADDYADSLREAGNMVRLNLNIATNSTAAPDSNVFDFIRGAYFEAGTAIWGRLIIDTIYTSINKTSYALDSNIVYVSSVIWQHADSLKSLMPVNVGAWGQLYDKRWRRLIQSDNDNDQYDNHSSYYDFVPGYIYLYPCPDKVDTMFIVNGYGRISDVMSDSTFVADFPAAYRSAPLYLATAKLGLALGISRAADYFKLYEAEVIKINNAILGVHEK